MPDRPPYYLTTPIYYVNARPHLGTAYSTIVTDTIARYKRAQGFDVFFLTGTDEHGQKIQRSANATNCTPQEFVDKVSAEFRALWDKLGLTYTDFIRTTEPRHKQSVQRLFTLLKERGYIYKGFYTGQYCVTDEAWVDVGAGRALPRLRTHHGNGHGRELLLQALRLRAQTARALRGATRFHPAGDTPQRGALVRARRPARSLHQPHQLLLGHPGAGR